MSRCYICDFSNDSTVGSLYNETLVLKRSRNNRVKCDTILGKDICEDCQRRTQLGGDDLRGEDAFDAYLEEKELE